MTAYDPIADIPSRRHTSRMLILIAASSIVLSWTMLYCGSNTFEDFRGSKPASGLPILLAVAGAVLSILSASPAFAGQTTWMDNGKPASEDRTRASKGAFGAMLVLTDDWSGFIKRWEQISPGFEVPAVNSIQKGQPLMSAVIFTGCKPDRAGNCLVTGDFTVLDPNGKTYADQRGAKIWSLPPPDPQLQLSVESLGLSLDPPDPLGTYVLTARVTDRIANKTLELRTTFVAK